METLPYFIDEHEEDEDEGEDEEESEDNGLIDVDQSSDDEDEGAEDAEDAEDAENAEDAEDAEDVEDVEDAEDKKEKPEEVDKRRDDDDEDKDEEEAAEENELFDVDQSSDEENEGDDYDEDEVDEFSGEGKDTEVEEEEEKEEEKEDIDELVKTLLLPTDNNENEGGAAVDLEAEEKEEVKVKEKKKDDTDVEIQPLSRSNLYLFFGLVSRSCGEKAAAGGKGEEENATNVFGIKSVQCAGLFGSLLGALQYVEPNFHLSPAVQRALVYDALDMNQFILSERMKREWKKAIETRKFREFGGGGDVSTLTQALQSHSFREYRVLVVLSPTSCPFYLQQQQESATKTIVLFRVKRFQKWALLVRNGTAVFSPDLPSGLLSNLTQNCQRSKNTQFPITMLCKEVLLSSTFQMQKQEALFYPPVLEQEEEEEEDETSPNAIVSELLWKAFTEEQRLKLTKYLPKLTNHKLKSAKQSKTKINIVVALLRLFWNVDIVNAKLAKLVAKQKSSVAEEEEEENEEIKTRVLMTAQMILPPSLLVAIQPLIVPPEAWNAVSKQSTYRMKLLQEAEPGSIEGMTVQTIRRVIRLPNDFVFSDIKATLSQCVTDYKKKQHKQEQKHKNNTNNIPCGNLTSESYLITMKIMIIVMWRWFLYRDQSNGYGYKLKPFFDYVKHVDFRRFRPEVDEPLDVLAWKDLAPFATNNSSLVTLATRQLGGHVKSRAFLFVRHESKVVELYDLDQTRHMQKCVKRMLLDIKELEEYKFVDVCNHDTKTFSPEIETFLRFSKSSLFYGLVFAACNATTSECIDQVLQSLDVHGIEQTLFVSAKVWLSEWKAHVLKKN